MARSDKSFLSSSFDPDSNSTVYENHTTINVIPSQLRLNDHYIFWYNNIAKLIITGILPFVLLCLFNFQVSSEPKFPGAYLRGVCVCDNKCVYHIPLEKIPLAVSDFREYRNYPPPLLAGRPIPLSPG